MNREPDDEVLLAVELTQMCTELRILPGPGGLLDQDPYHIMLLKAGLSAMHEKAKRDMPKK